MFKYSPQCIDLFICLDEFLDYPSAGIIDPKALYLSILNEMSKVESYFNLLHIDLNHRNFDHKLYILT